MTSSLLQLIIDGGGGACWPSSLQEKTEFFLENMTLTRGTPPCTPHMEVPPPPPPLGQGQRLCTRHDHASK